VRPEVVVEEQCIIPPDGLVKGFHLVAGLMFDQTLANRESFLTLATLRDTLLPKLLSGELTVGEVPREATA
jgi:type I restriction enzyme S subunit